MRSTLPTLETARLRLRSITKADAPALFRIFADPEVARYTSRPPLEDMRQAVALVHEIARGLRERRLLQWGVTIAGGDDVIGTCTLAAWDHRHHRAELGFALGRAHWGRRIMSEAARAIVEFGFETLGLHRIVADADPRNQASIRILERLGFRREGFLREHYVLCGELQDAVAYGLLRAEWESTTPRDR